MSFNSGENFDDQGLSDRELPDRSDMTPADDDETMACPYCKSRIYEHSEFCPRCGKYISEDDSANQLPVWMVVGVVILILVIVFGWVL